MVMTSYDLQSRGQQIDKIDLGNKLLQKDPEKSVRSKQSSVVYYLYITWMTFLNGYFRIYFTESSHNKHVMNVSYFTQLGHLWENRSDLYKMQGSLWP